MDSLGSLHKILWSADMGFNACCCDACMNCVHGTDAADGCCHKHDTLVLWNERPAFSNHQHYTHTSPGPGGQLCETCFTYSQAAMPAVQSIYRYHICHEKTYLVPPGGGMVSFVTLPVSDGDVVGKGCVNPYCDAGYPGDACCEVPTSGLYPNPGNCVWNAWYGVNLGGMSNWRRDVLYANDASRWFIEALGHKGNTALGGAAGYSTLQNEFLFLTHHEKWWRCPEDCAAEAAVYVPNCPGGECGGVAYNTSHLVPRWWIFACSGIPIFKFDIDDAVRFGVLSGGEGATILADVATNTTPPEPLIKKLADVYGRANDWRGDQRQIYIDLHARFPTEGYGAYIQDCALMPVLGPFRKRLTEPIVGVNNQPLLHKNDVITQLSATQASWKPYNNATYPSQADYDYWCERQWVYYSAVPGGWDWGSWTVTEEQLLDGIGRSPGINESVIELITAPMLAFAGNPRPQATCTDCGGGALCAGYTYCNTCNGGCDDCGAAPLAACAPPISCQRFVVQPYCEGVRFVSHQYNYENDITAGEPCVGSGRFKCMTTVFSYLTGAKRTCDSWTATCPWNCNTQSPPLAPFAGWTAIDNATTGHHQMCNHLIDPINNPLPVYLVGDMCCGSYCENATAVVVPGVGTFYCPTIFDGPNCPSTTECPPHSTNKQIACVGHPIQDCDP